MWLKTMPNTKPAVINPCDAKTPVWWQHVTWMRGKVAKKVPAQDVNDLLQEIFLALLRNPVPEGAPTKAWVSKLLTNHIANYYRAAKTPNEPLEESLPEAPQQGVLPTETTVASWLQFYALSLPEKYRLPLIWADFEGKRMVEIAEALNLTVSGAKSRVQRARKMVGEALQACCRFEFDHMGRVTKWYPLPKEDGNASTTKKHPI